MMKLLNERINGISNHIEEMIVEGDRTDSIVRAIGQDLGMSSRDANTVFAFVSGDTIFLIQIGEK